MSRERMQQEKENTFRRILDTAWEIAVKEGVEAISIRKIASALQFAPNNLYHYFKNKNELLQYMKKDAYQWAIDIVANIKYESESICGLLEEISERMLQCALEEPQKYVVMTSDFIMDEQDSLDYQLTDYFAEMIRKGIASGELKEADPVITAINMRMIQVGFVRRVSSDKTLTKEKIVEMHDNLTHILFEGIRKGE